MRQPTQQELLATPPPDLRQGSKTTQAYLAVRRQILTGELAPGETLSPRQIEDAYQLNNTTTQMLLLRLAAEGLVEVLPVREHTWPRNASFNSYRVADFSGAHKHLIQAPSIPEATSAPADSREILSSKIQYADSDIAALLALSEGDKVVWYREREGQAPDAIVTITDTYTPFWFAEMLPELERPEQDLLSLLRQAGREPAQCQETVEVGQAGSVERVLFALSADDPAPLLKVQRQIFDAGKQPLAVQFVTLRGERYRLQYTFSLASHR
jgi:DNA-binding GntR family transcriptional regulator